MGNGWPYTSTGSCQPTRKSISAHSTTSSLPMSQPSLTVSPTATPIETGSGYNRRPPTPPAGSNTSPSTESSTSATTPQSYGSLSLPVNRGHGSVPAST